MAIDYTTDPGGLFVKLGKLFANMKETRTWQKTTADTRIDSLYAQFMDPSESLYDLDDLSNRDIKALWDSFKAARDGMIASLSADARRAIREEVNRTYVLSSPENDDEALRWLIEDMGDNSETLNYPGGPSVNLDPQDDPEHVTSLTADGDNVGNTEVGITWAVPYMYNETLRAEVDATGKIYVRGEPYYPFADYRWPAGSGPGPTMTIVDPGTSGSGEATTGTNMLRNTQDWACTVANTPDYWRIVTGAAGLDILQATSGMYDGDACLKISGAASGGSAVDLRQYFNSNTYPTQSTQGYPKVSAKHIISFRIKGSAAAVAASGGWHVAVSVNGETSSTGELMTSSVPTAWTFKKFAIDIPVALSDVDYIRIYTDAALLEGEYLLIDNLAMTLAYTHGPYRLAAFAGDTTCETEDHWTGSVLSAMADTNLVYWLNGIYGLSNGKRIFPTDAMAGETIPDSLITT